MIYAKVATETQYEYCIRVASACDIDECVLWPFYVNPNGYGTVNNPRPNRKTIFVHRLAFYGKYGRWPPPEGLHRCDNTLCFNPTHIFEGTHADNMKDKAEKGRASKLMGENHPRHKLKEHDVRNIIAAYDPIIM